MCNSLTNIYQFYITPERPARALPSAPEFPAIVGQCKIRPEFQLDSDED